MSATSIRASLVSAPSSARPYQASVLRSARPVHRERLATMPKAAKHVFALDFDGVVCDSVGESSLSALKAATALWPEIFDTPEARARTDELVEKMRIVRPVVETGYENIVQIRALFEGVSAEDMLANWRTMLPECMEQYGVERADMVELFGSTRDAWIERDLNDWLAPNRIYPGIPEAVSAAQASDETYIVTTKQARFTEILMRDMAGVPFDMERIYSQTVSGKPKSEVLAKLMEMHPDTTYHFVEDKMSTLEKVAKIPELDAWKLYLVDWGYNTVEEREKAAASDRIELIDINRFTEVLTTTAAVEA